MKPWSEPMQLARKRASATLVCLLVASCQTMGSGAIDPKSSALLFCDAMTPFRWSREDTRQTQEQATEINAIGVRECHWEGHRVPTE